MPQESLNVTEECAPEIAPVEQQELTPTDTYFEKSNTERTESDTGKEYSLKKGNKNRNLVSGDSWEREFDETDLVTPSHPSTSDADPLTKSVETVTSESVSPSTTEPETKKKNEFDDEWEGWS